MSLFMWLLAWQAVTALLALAIVLGKEAAMKFERRRLRAELKATIAALVAVAIAWGALALLTIAK